MINELVQRAYHFYDEMGYIPTSTDYRVIPNTPSLPTIYKYFRIKIN